MATAALLRPSEESWQGQLENLVKRFDQLEPAVIVDTLRANEGHAGRTAQALRKLPPGGAAPAPKPAVPTVAVAKEGYASKKAVEAPAIATVKAVASPAKAVVKKAALPRPSSPVKARQEPAERDDSHQPSKPAVPTFRKPSLTKPVEVIPPAVVEEVIPVAVMPAAPPPAVVNVEPVALAPSGPPPPDSKLLFVAALQEDIQELVGLINAGADLNGRYTGRPNRAHEDKIIDATALHLVVTMGKANVAEALLNHGADFEAKMRRALGPGKPPEEQYSQMTALHLAAMEGHANIVEMLIACGANKGAKMELFERDSKTASGRDLERTFTPLEIAKEMQAKGHPRESVISLLSK